MGKPVGRAAGGGHRGRAFPALWPCLPGSPGLQRPERTHHHSAARDPPQTSIRAAQRPCCVMGLSWGGLRLSMQCKIFVKISSESLAPWWCMASLASCVSGASRGVLRPLPRPSVHRALSTVPQTAFSPDPVLGPPCRAVPTAPCDVSDGAQHLLGFSRPCSRGQHYLRETPPWRLPCQGHS